MNYRNLMLPSLVAAIVCTLSACGGGLLDALNKDGSFNPSATVDKSEFLGEWVYPPSLATKDCTTGGSTGVYVDRGSVKVILTDTTYSEILDIYSDSACKDAAGEGATQYTINWLALRFPTRQNVAGVSGTLSSATLGNKDLTKEALSGQGAIRKSALDIVDGKLYAGDSSSPMSADNYPTAFISKYWIRSK
jgi:hypothetical protein